MSKNGEVEVAFEISADGTVKIDVIGGNGASCKALTAPYEALLSGVETKELKDEYHNVETDARQKAGHG